MNKWWYKILFLLIGISFTLAVFEIDPGGRHNTFHDDDDTYVQSNNQSVEIGGYFEKQKEAFTELSLFASTWVDLFSADLKTSQNPSLQKNTNFSPPKLFLRNSILQI